MATAVNDKLWKKLSRGFEPPKKQTIIAFLSQKGGVGKTTTAAHARDWFEQFGSVGFVDADAQRSSSKWLSAIDPQIAYSVMGEARTLLRELPNEKEKYDYVIVDAPGSLEEVSRAILSRCDLVVIPCQTSQLDLESNDTTIEMVEIAQDIRGGVPHAALFFNRAEEGTILLREALAVAKQEVDQQHVHSLDAVIFKRQCIMDVPGQKTTVFREAQEIEQRRMQRKSKQGDIKLSPSEIARNDYCKLFEEITRILNG